MSMRGVTNGDYGRSALCFEICAHCGFDFIICVQVTVLSGHVWHEYEEYDSRGQPLVAVPH